MSPDSVYSITSPSFAFDLSDGEDEVEVHGGEDVETERQWTSFWPRSDSIDTSVDAASPVSQLKSSTPDAKNVAVAELSRPPSVVKMAHRIPSLESGFRRGSDSSLLAAVLDRGRRRSSGRSVTPSVLDRRRSSVLSKASVATDDSEHMRKFQAMNAAVGRRFSEVIQVQVAPTSPTLSASSSSDSEVEERDWAPEVPPRVTQVKLNIWSPDTPNSAITEDASEVASLSPQETPVAPSQPVVETLSNFPLNSTVAVAASGYAFPGPSNDLRMDRYINTPSPPLDPGAFLRRAQRPAFDRAKSEQLPAKMVAGSNTIPKQLHHRSISASSTLFAAGADAVELRPKRLSKDVKQAASVVPATESKPVLLRKSSLVQDVAEFQFLASEIVLQPDAAMPPFPVKATSSAPPTASSTSAAKRPAMRRPISMQEMISVVQTIERESSNSRSRPRSGEPAIAAADQIHWNEDWAKGRQTTTSPSTASETSPGGAAAPLKVSRKPVPELDTPRSDATLTPHAHQHSPESHQTSPRERDSDNSSRRHHQSQHRRRRCRRCEEKRALRILAEAARITADMRLSPRTLYEDDYHRHHHPQHAHEWSSSPSHHHRAASNDLPPPPSSMMPRHHYHSHHQRPGHERSLTDVTPSHAAYFASGMPPSHSVQWAQNVGPEHAHGSSGGSSPYGQLVSRHANASGPSRAHDISRPTLMHTTSHRDDLMPLPYQPVHESRPAMSSRPRMTRSATDISTEPAARHQLRHKTSAALSRFIHGFGSGSTSPKSGSEHHYREAYHA